MKLIFIFLLITMMSFLISCGGDVETINNRDPISRLWIPVNEDSVDLYLSNIFINVLDVPVPFYNNLGDLACTCSAFFTGTPTKGVYNMSCPVTCSSTFTRFETGNGSYEVSENNILLICPDATRRDLCVEYK